ncbi:MAG TPA: ATP-binding protein [Dehalococcoidia bacterium]|nr:ATP-binding protein [Dehalococcoidia bacterium]
MIDLAADPGPEVRSFKRRVYLVALLVLLLVTPIYTFALGLTAAGAVFLFLVSLLAMAIAIECLLLYNKRMRMRIAYPYLLGFSLISIRDFAEAAEKAVEMVGNWLHADAAIIAWLSEDGDSLHPMAAYGMPPYWHEDAPRINMGSRTLRQAVKYGAIFKPSTDGDPWFDGFHLNHQVVYVPLVNRDVALGVLAVSGNMRRWELRDRRLLSGLGIVLAISLDNARLSEGEREHARHMQQLAQMKSSFLQVVSHELRTPLTSIKTAAEMLLEEEESENPEGAKARLTRNIVKGASRLTTMVADLMETAKQDELAPRLEMAPVRMAEMATNALAVVYPLITTKQQHVEVTLGPAPGPQVLGDQPRLEQVLVNLLANANRFTPVGGKIALEMRDEGDDIVIAVADSGPGVPAKERERIFDPFYRGDRTGMGMGLAIAKAITEMHRGRIWIQPNETGGSVFCVSLPMYQEPLEPAELAAQTARR